MATKTRVKNYINMDFTSKISIFDQNFGFWAKFRFLNEISIFDQNFDFWPKMSMFDQISMFGQISILAQI